MSEKACGYIIGIMASLAMLYILLHQDFESWHAPGVYNPGHEELDCKECHISSEGTIRQQLQANTSHLLGKRQLESDFVFIKITNKQCIACHDRDDDHHPTYRFNEPKFKKVREKIHPEFCISCHQEHSGKRISHFKITDCQLCHKETRIEDDSISIPHHELIKRKDWDSCMGCHDFHGNHDMKLETQLSKLIKPSKIINYFKTAPPPYAGQLINKAKKTIYEK